MKTRWRLIIAALFVCFTSACAPAEGEAGAEEKQAKSKKSAKAAMRVPRSPQGAKVSSASGQSWVTSDTHPEPE